MERRVPFTVGVHRDPVDVERVSVADNVDVGARTIQEGCDRLVGPDGEARPCADGRRDPTGIEVIRVFVGNQQGIRADRCIWRAENSGIDDDRNAILLDTHPRMSERRHLQVLPVCRRTAGGGRRGLICLRASRGLKEGRRGRKRSDHSRATPKKESAPGGVSLQCVQTVLALGSVSRFASGVIRHSCSMGGWY